VGSHILRILQAVQRTLSRISLQLIGEPNDRGKAIALGPPPLFSFARARTLSLWQVKWPKKKRGEMPREMTQEWAAKNGKNEEKSGKLQSSFCWQCFLTVQLLRFDVLDVLYSTISFSNFQDGHKSCIWTWISSKLQFLCARACPSVQQLFRFLIKEKPYRLLNKYLSFRLLFIVCVSVPCSSCSS